MYRILYGKYFGTPKEAKYWEGPFISGYIFVIFRGNILRGDLCFFSRILKRKNLAGSSSTAMCSASQGDVKPLFIFSDVKECFFSSPVGFS